MTLIKSFTTNSFLLNPSIFIKIVTAFLLITIISTVLFIFLGLTIAKISYVLLLLLLLIVVKALKKNFRSELMIFDEGIRVTLPYCISILDSRSNVYFFGYDDIRSVQQVNPNKGTIEIKTKDCEVRFCIPYDQDVNAEIIRIITNKLHQT